MRHPSEAFVQAELAYRAHPWNPGLLGGSGVGGLRGVLRILGERRRHAEESAAVGVGPTVPAPPVPDRTPGSPEPVHRDRLATVHPLRRTARKPDAA